MRFIFKTDYDQDIRLVKHGGQAFWYALLGLLLLAAPWSVGDYWLTQLSFILIYSIAGLGLMVLAGFTGLASLGHAAFLGVGAYAHVFLLGLGWPFLLAIASAAALAASVGVIVSLPAMRVKGIYLAIATQAFGFIVEEVFARWESVTGGNSGKSVSGVVLFGHEIGSGEGFYYLCLALCVLATLGVLNLLRSGTGRAFIAIRDSEISAQSMGIAIARYKTLAFAISAALTGVAGALYAHKLRFISPDQFGALQSIELLLLVVVGGLGSVHGAFLGAIFLIAMPQLIAVSKDLLPPAIGQASGLQALVYGLVLVGIVLFEPMGLYGRWLKIRTYFQLFPFYRRGMFKRQKAFTKSERLR
ncbi:MAG: branched-chain amino acid ABC transporter permease [Ideonella sp.]|nr:branched-chain amino acid ABC transporter permease [Ideonella sp.]MCC7459421.1 branched-chain amino acid ABC transporter permease [Nitrospira sp.]